MAQDLSAQIVISADASGVETGIGRAKKSLSDLGVTASAAGKQAATGLDTIGQSGEAVSKKVQAATNNLVNSIQRQIATIEAGQKGGSKFFETLATQRGVPVDVLRPYLDQLDQVSAKQKTAADGFTRLGEQGRAALDRIRAGDRLTAGLSKSGISAAATAELQALEAVKARQQTIADGFTRLGQQGRASFDRLALGQQLAAGMSQAGAAAAGAGNAVARSAKQFNEFGLSTKQTTAALRQVPAQFTDIITSLQGGQAPLTVLLQQGGQLRDVFGGIAPAARALGGFVLGLINPFTIAAAVVGSLALAYKAGSAEADELARALILSGNAAGSTVGQLTSLAKSISAVVGTQAAASEALAAFAATGDVANASLERVATAAIRLERAGGQAIAETVKQFSALAKDPLQASIKLNETTRFLTLSIYQQIKALEDQGKTTEAAALAQKSYADVIDQRAGQIADRLGIIERAWLAIKDATKAAIDAALNVGRTDTLQDQLAGAQKRLDDLQARGQLGARGGKRQSTTNTEIDAQKTVIANLSEQIRLENKAAEAKKAAADQVKARIEFDREGQHFITKQVQQEQAIAKARAQGLAAGASQVEIDKRIADIREKFRDKSKKADPQKGIDKSELAFDISGIKAEAERLTSIFSNSERVLDALRSSGLISDSEYYESKRQFLELTGRAQEDALQKEIARLGQEKLSGKDAIDNARKVAEAEEKLARVRGDNASKLVLLTIQQDAAVTRLKLAFLSARQAAQDYFDTTERQQARELADFGQGTQERNRNSGISQIEDRYAGQRRDLENQKALLELEGKFTEEAKAQYEQRLSIINEFQAKSIASFTSYYAKLISKQSDFSLGANEALSNYISSAGDLAKQTEDLFSRTFGGLEDALTEFASKGKLSFTALADSIIADINRIIIRQQITKPLAELIQGGFKSGEGLGGIISKGLGALFGKGGSPLGESAGIPDAVSTAAKAADTAAIGASTVAITAQTTSTAAGTAATVANTAATTAAIAATTAETAAAAAQTAAFIALTTAASSAAIALSSVAVSAGSKGVSDVFTSLGGADFGDLSSLTSGFGGFFANGGSPPLGKVSVVGEKGPELFVPRSPGTIVPMSPVAGGGSGGNQFNVTLNQTFAAGTTRQTVEQAAAAAARALQSQAARGTA